MALVVAGRGRACACASRGRSAPPRPASGILQVADVEDAHAAEALVADLRRHALRCRSRARPRVCSTDMNSRLPQIDTSPWPPGQTTERDQLRLVGALDVVGVEAVVVADHDVAAAEREVRVGVASWFGLRRVGRRVRIGRRQLGSRSGGVASPAGSLSKKPSGFGRFATSSMFSRGLAGVAQARLQFARGSGCVDGRGSSSAPCARQSARLRLATPVASARLPAVARGCRRRLLRLSDGDRRQPASPRLRGDVVTPHRSAP